MQIKRKSGSTLPANQQLEHIELETTSIQRTIFSASTTVAIKAMTSVLQSALPVLPVWVRAA